MKNLNQMPISELEELLTDLDEKIYNPKLSLGLINTIYNKKKCLYIDWEKDNFIKICQKYKIPYKIKNNMMLITNNNKTYKKLQNKNFKNITNKELGLLLGYPEKSVNYRCSNKETANQMKYLKKQLNRRIITKKDIIKIESYNFYNIKPTENQLIIAKREAKQKNILYTSISESIKNNKMNKIKQDTINIFGKNI